jgi:putative hemolysin
MGNFLLQRIPELRDFLIAVDPFDRDDSNRFNFKPLKESIQWLTNGGALLIFPAGAVSHLQVKQRRITDPPWNRVVARFVRKTGASVLPASYPTKARLQWIVLSSVPSTCRQKSRSRCLRAGSPLSCRGSEGGFG